MKDIILSESQISEIVLRLGNELTEALKDEEKLPVFIGVMKGALPFFTDLMKRVDREILADFIQISSYEGTSSTGNVALKKDITLDLSGRTAVIVEDIVDTGLSMEYLVNHIRSKNPKRILVVAMFDKYVARRNNIVVDYAGVKLSENKFLVGYGLDYNEACRNYPCVGNLLPEEKAELDAIFAKENN